MSKYENLNLQFINGTWKAGSSAESAIKDVNPFNGELLLEVKPASKGDVNDAYTAAKEAAKTWGLSNYTQRREVLEKALEIFLSHKDEFIDWLIKESGSTQIKSAIEFGLSVEAFKHSTGVSARARGFMYPSSVPGKESRIYRKPLGVIGVISPWNFPFYLTLRSVAYALALGNTVVIKPAPASPVTGATFMAKIFEEAGLPAGVLNVIVGTNEEIGDAFVEHPVPRLISFTGSTKVGRHIGEICGRLLKKAALEMGGNNVFIVREDADIDYAVRGALFGKFLHQGQICMSINRILVHEKVYHEFVDKFAAKTREIKAGDPSDPSVSVGPLIEERQVTRILKSLEQSVKHGAKIILGGKADGNVFEPTVVVDATNDMPLACDEIFGPVAVIIKYKDDAEAIQFANATEYGLSGSIHTRDLDKGARMAQQIETGMVHVNDQPVNDEPHSLFGGEKSSGLSKFNGEQIVDEFTTLQLVTVQYEQRPFPWGN
jgi:aldehyde dehydrogenase (NAD+)